ncbi:MAG: host attachment protein [Cyanobacteria bacterium]|nr:host attachment protein [Cyanobacteriota bacterium]
METLAALEPSPFPVISLYLSLTADQNSRENWDQFVRKVFNERGKALRVDSPERGSFDKDAERIRQYLDQPRDAACRGLAIFASSGSELFEAIPLETEFDDHWMFVGSVPHLYPLAKLIDSYPRYVSVMLDTNRARIVVSSLAAAEREAEIKSDKTRRTSKGGWSQARYQRRADNVHMHHMKEVVDTLDKIVREENINQIVIAADENVLPKLKEQMPAHLAEKIVDTVTLQRHGAAGDAMLETTFDAIRARDAESDVEKVQELMDEWQGSGLGVTGPEATLSAFELGQVEELIITGSVDTLKPVQKLPETAAAEMTAETSAANASIDEARLKLSAELIKRAQTTAARIRFIEDAALLQEVGGVGALLRFRI